MTIFDLVFLVSMLATVLALITMLAFLIRGRFRSALKLLGVYAVCAAVYLAVGVAVSFARPQRVMAVGDPWCFDDWCLAVDKVTRAPESADVHYQVDLRVFRRAGRVSQRAKGAWIYLIDSQGHRFSPEPRPSDVPLDVLLKPEESVATSRTFPVPA